MDLNKEIVVSFHIIIDHVTPHHILLQFCEKWCAIVQGVLNVFVIVIVFAFVFVVVFLLRLFRGH